MQIQGDDDDEDDEDNGDNAHLDSWGLEGRHRDTVVERIPETLRVDYREAFEHQSRLASDCSETAIASKNWSHQT